MNPLAFRGFSFLLIFPMLLSLSTVSTLPATGSIKHPVKFIIGEENLAPPPRPAATEDTLVLAANRTRRPDILRGFHRYPGGWDVANHHYWASVGFTGGVGFVLAIIWFISFGLALAIHLCCGGGVNIKNHGSNYSQRICLVLLIFFTFTAVTGCILLFIGQNKFHGEVLDTLDYVVNQSDYTVQILRNVTEYLSIAKSITVTHMFLPSDLMDAIDKLDVDLHRAANTLSEKTMKYSVKFRRAFKDVRLALFVVAAVVLLLTLAGLVLSVRGYHYAILIFVITGWLLVAATFVLFGVFMTLNNAISDTCMATGEWVENPNRDSALSDVLPCVNPRITNRTLIQSKRVVNCIVLMVNDFIYETANINGRKDATPRTLTYYNQSGPEILPLCYPFDAQFQERPCSDLEISLVNASMVWKKSECEVSKSGICTTVGRVTPEIYSQLVVAVNGTYALAHYTPLLLSLQNCNFVRDAFTGITSSHCPPLNHYLKITSVGLCLISVGVLLCVVLWILYAGTNREQREN